MPTLLTFYRSGNQLRHWNSRAQYTTGQNFWDRIASDYELRFWHQNSVRYLDFHLVIQEISKHRGIIKSKTFRMSKSKNQKKENVKISQRKSTDQNSKQNKASTARIWIPRLSKCSFHLLLYVCLTDSFFLNFVSKAALGLLHYYSF